MLAAPIVTVITGKAAPTLTQWVILVMSEGARSPDRARTKRARWVARSPEPEPLISYRPALVVMLPRPQP
jgi:hypothetical protein